MKKNMKIYQENKEKIEDYLFIITVLIFVISTIANAPHMFSPAGEATLWGAICSYSYLEIWLVATYVLRKRKGWIWSTFIVRIMTIVSICLTMLLTKFNLDIKNMLWAIIAYIPFGLLVPVYGGIYKGFLQSWWFYAIPLGQAIISTVLFVRMQLQRTA